jgi:hypothetical protein
MTLDKKITDITDINDLVTLKEECKSQIVNPSVHWEVRMSLYEKVQFINKQIQRLQDKIR